MPTAAPSATPVASSAPVSAVSPPPAAPKTAKTAPWWKAHTQPLTVLRYLLSALAILATLSWEDWRVNPDEWLTAGAKWGLILLGAWAAMQVLKQFKVKPSVRWEHRFISATILFLLFAPDAPWFGFLVLGAITETLQRLVRLPTGPVFNPAAAGTLVTALLLQRWAMLPTWWGVSFSPRWYVIPEGLSIASLVLVPVAIWIAWKYKKLWTSLALILASAVTYFVVFGVSPSYLVFEGTLFFFALVMASEPKTSPVLRNEQLIFGTLIGVVMVLLLKIYFIEAYAGSLLLGNLLYNGNRWLKMRRVRAPKKALV
jgi:hypothetical protein